MTFAAGVRLRQERRLSSSRKTLCVEEDVVGKDAAGVGTEF
jgi:hypothetical protein